MENETIKEILSLADLYERKLKSYHFYNWELEELERIEKEINDKISPFLDNEEILLGMIKEKWSIIQMINYQTRGNDFILKASALNPECAVYCALHTDDLQLLIELYRINPKIVKHIEDVLEYKYEGHAYHEFLKLYKSNQLNLQQESQVYYSLDGQPHRTLEEALMKNDEIQDTLSTGHSL